MTKKTVEKNVTALEMLLTLIKGAKQGKQAYRDNIQKALELFVKEYNGALRFNSKPFKEIVMTVGKDIKDLRNWVFTYTNITKVYSDLEHFETSDYTVKDEKKLYELKFKDEYNGQLWYNVETDKKAVKELSNETFMASAKALYKRYSNSFVNYDEKTEKLMQTIKSLYNLD